MYRRQRVSVDEVCDPLQHLSNSARRVSVLIGFSASTSATVVAVSYPL